MLQTTIQRVVVLKAHMQLLLFLLLLKLFSLLLIQESVLLGQRMLSSHFQWVDILSPVSKDGYKPEIRRVVVTPEEGDKVV